MSIDVSFQGTAVGRRENRRRLLWVDSASSSLRATVVRPAPDVKRRYATSNDSYRSFVAASGCRSLLAFKVQRSAVAKTAAGSYGSKGIVRRQARKASGQPGTTAASSPGPARACVAARPPGAVACPPNSLSSDVDSDMAVVRQQAAAPRWDAGQEADDGHHDVRHGALRRPCVRRTAARSARAARRLRAPVACQRLRRRGAWADCGSRTCQAHAAHPRRAPALERPASSA